MTKERIQQIKRTVFDEYDDVIDRLSEGFDGYDSALRFGRVLGQMEKDLVYELEKECKKGR